MPPRGAVAPSHPGGGSRAIDSIYFLSAAPNPADAGASLVALMPATSLDGAAGRILLAFSRDGLRWRGLRTLAHTESEGATGRTSRPQRGGCTDPAARPEGNSRRLCVQRNVPGIGGDGEAALRRIDIRSSVECWTQSALTHVTTRCAATFNPPRRPPPSRRRPRQHALLPRPSGLIAARRRCRSCW